MNEDSERSQAQGVGGLMPSQNATKLPMDSMVTSRGSCPLGCTSKTAGQVTMKTKKKKNSSQPMKLSQNGVGELTIVPSLLRNLVTYINKKTEASLQPPLTKFLSAKFTNCKKHALSLRLE